MNYLKILWDIINSILINSPVFLLLSLFAMFVLFRVIPYATIKIWNWKKGITISEKLAKEKSRKTLELIGANSEINTNKIIKIEKHLREQNGNFRSHVSNYDIHVPKNELVTKELFLNETKHINESINALFDRVNK